MIRLDTIRYAGQFRALGKNTAMRVMLDLDAKRIVRQDPFRNARPVWQKRAFWIDTLCHYVHFLYVTAGTNKALSLASRMLK